MVLSRALGKRRPHIVGDPISERYVVSATIHENLVKILVFFSSVWNTRHLLIRKFSCELQLSEPGP